MDQVPLGSVTFSASCAYCGANLALEAGESPTVSDGESLDLLISWDHTCTMPPPMITSQLGN